MNQTYRNILKWTLYGFLFLLVMMVQTVILGSRTILGTRLSLVPVAVACVACTQDHESGGLYALLCALAWTLSGESTGAVYLLMLPIAACVGGYLCSTYLTHGLLPSLAMCLLALSLCEGGVYLLRLFMGAPLPSNALELVGTQVGLSLVTAPLWWGLARLIGKTGGTYGT